MAYSFQEIMKYHPDNQDVYDEIKSHLSDLIPFVGAGLTAFAYSSWTDALKTLTEYVTETPKKREIRQLIQDKKLLEAAQVLENTRGSTRLSKNLVKLFSAEKLEDKRDQLPREAISLLPYLFPNLVLTTNFDETLETVYRDGGHPFAGVFHPGHTELLRSYLRADGVGGLMKLHGTITGPNIEYSQIVFTEQQYDRHYGPGSPLVADLTACFRQRMMLFLGCSLEKDRTVELLHQIRQEGEYNYAIISCPKSKRDARLRELGNLGIRAIAYPKGRHEAVRVILEQLLADTQNDVYQSLPFRAGELRNSSINRFAYNADLISFTGREKELARLQEFLGVPDAFRWWAIVGPGGSGKSRLAYELQKQLPPGWEARWLARGDYGNLSALTPKLTQPTLLIADYVQQYAQELGQWMQELLEQHRSRPLRLLLVERDSSQAQEGFSWERQLYLRADQGNLEKARFAPFLALQPLEDSSLGEIMANYAKEQANQTLPEDARAMLLERLHFVDPQFQRPLYALFLTDAWLEDPKKPERWNRENVLDYVTLREQDRLKLSIQDTFGRPIPALHRACLHLHAMATVCQDAPYAQLEALCPKDWQTVTGKAEDYDGPEELLQFIGLGNKDGVDALRPDLVGEYFVLSWLKQHADQAKAFLQAAWQNPEATVVFLDRTIRDYAHLLNESPDHWQLLFPDIRMESPDAAFWAAQLLINAIVFCTIPSECARLAGRLEAIADAYPNVPEIAIAFAQGLVNLSNKQDAQGAADTVHRLEQLRNDHPDIPEITIEFAKGLFNLAYEQDAQGATDTVHRLEQLMTDHPDIPEIAIRFAKGLFNLSNQQDIQGREKTINRLEQLMTDHPGIPEIAIRFAKGLSNLANAQDIQERENTIHRLEQLMTDHPGISEIAIAFAQGLTNLSAKQDAQGAADTVHRLEQLVEQHPSVPEITAEFAKGLFNLAAEQDVPEATNTVNRLEQLMNKHPGVPEIAIALARGLVNLSYDQDATGATNSVNCLEQLVEQHPDIPELAIRFAQGLLNLSMKQDAQGVVDTVNRLEQLAKEHPGISEIAIEFAHGLANLSLKQDAQGAADTVSRLEQLIIDYPNVLEITIALSCGLLNLSLKQDAQGAADAVKRLEQLLEKHSDITEIAIVFAHVLVNLSAEQDAQGRAKTSDRLEQLVKDHPDTPEIAIEFAKGLFNLANAQDIQERENTIHRLEQLMTDHPDIPEIAIEFAKGLFNLACEQDTQGAADTVNRLEQLLKDHPDIPEIAIEFANGQFNLSCDQDAAEAADTVSRLEQLAKNHPGVPDIAILFAQGLVNLSNKQDAQGAADTIHRLEQLMTDHPDIPEIAIAFAKGLVNLSNKQDAQGAADTVHRLEQLMNNHPDIPEIAIAFAKGLFNLACEQDVQGRENASYRLEQLVTDHPDIPEIAIEFAKGLFNLALKQDAQGQEKTIQRLKSLADGTVPVPNIAAEFAQCNLTMLTASDEETRRAASMRAKQILADLHLS